MGARKQPPLVVALLVVTGVVAVQALLVPLFASPAASIAPRDLPVVVAGPEPAADQLAGRLVAVKPGAFDLTRAPDAATADAMLRDREAYAAFILGPDGLRLHTATAASPAVAQLLTRATADLPGDAAVPTVDVVPGSADDARGSGFGAGFLPLVLTSLLAGVALLVAAPGRTGRLAGLGAYGVLGGLVGAAILQNWLGVVGGSYLPVAAAIGLLLVAVAAAVTGLGAALGPPGVGLAALLVFLVGNPLSAVAAAPELLPQPWGAIGQWLPPGAGGTLLRSVAWFDGAGAAQPLWVLAGWAVLGLALVLVGRATLPALQRPGAHAT